ncbi:hypothetical protein HK102_001263 [Quaeritorhiza haematococci]|nr:hypothetical protein HK102_001263 [Quaeritorhiza haematococci]
MATMATIDAAATKMATVAKGTILRKNGVIVPGMGMGLTIGSNCRSMSVLSLPSQQLQTQRPQRDHHRCSSKQCIHTLSSSSFRSATTITPTYTTSLRQHVRNFSKTFLASNTAGLAPSSSSNTARPPPALLTQTPYGPPSTTGAGSGSSSSPSPTPSTKNTLTGPSGSASTAAATGTASNTLAAATAVVHANPKSWKARRPEWFRYFVYENTVTQDEVIIQLVNNIMKDGKKYKAEKQVRQALDYMRKDIEEHVRAVTAAKANPTPAIGGSSSSNTVDLSMYLNDPIAAMKDAIEKCAPLVRIVSSRRGAKNVLTPRPLNDRRRRRTAIMWIVDASSSGGRGKIKFPERLAREMMNVLKGESSALSKKMQLYKQALANRSNIIMVDRKMGRF